MMDFLLVHKCLNHTENTFWVDVIKSGLPSFIALLGVILSARYAYKYAIRKMHAETQQQLRKTEVERRIEALEAIWGLLAYLTTTENEKSILIWEREKGSKNDKFFIRTNQGREFLTNLPKTFYENGHGLFISTSIKELLFKYRSNIYGFLLKETTEEKIEIKNDGLVKSLKETYDSLNQHLKDELNKEKENS